MDISREVEKDEVIGGCKSRGLYKWKVSKVEVEVIPDVNTRIPPIFVADVLLAYY